MEQFTLCVPTSQPRRRWASPSQIGPGRCTYSVVARWRHPLCFYDTAYTPCALLLPPCFPLSYRLFCSFHSLGAHFFVAHRPSFFVQDQINSRVDLVLRMADEKWRLAQHAYDRLDVNIRRLDADLGRMEVTII